LQSCGRCFALRIGTARIFRKFEDIGTRSFPLEQGIGEAINFHEAIGTRRKQERLFYLRDLLVDAGSGDEGREAAYVREAGVLVRDRQREC